MRAKVRDGYEATRGADADAAEKAYRLGAAQLDNVEATARHLTEVFKDERVHARV